MQGKTKLFSIVLAAAMLIATDANAVLVPRPIGNESRIKVVNYVPNKSIRFVGHYNYNSIIEFETGETIQTITMGDSKGWQMNPQENRIFLKPIAEDATTNMTVITNRRTYFFEMHAEYADNISDPHISFMVKFMYPDNQNTTNIVPTAVGSTATTGGDVTGGGLIDLSNPSKYNFKYKVSGNGGELNPILVFDDGAFTYFKFRDVNSTIPAIFNVNAEGNESLINYRVTDGFVVVERVSERFTLRRGQTVICVFNEGKAAPIQVPSVKILDQQQQQQDKQMQQVGAVMSAPDVQVMSPQKG